MTEDPAAREMLGYLFVRGGVHAVAYAQGAGEADRRRTQARCSRSREIREQDSRSASRSSSKGLHREALPVRPDDYRDLRAIWKGPHPENGDELVSWTAHPKARDARPVAAQQAHRCRRQRLSAVRDVSHGQAAHWVGAIRTPSREVRDITRGTGTTS